MAGNKGGAAGDKGRQVNGLERDMIMKQQQHRGGWGKGMGAAAMLGLMLMVVGATGPGRAQGGEGEGLMDSGQVVVLRLPTTQIMKAWSAPAAGRVVETLGYYQPGDGGGAVYIIRPATDELQANDGDVIGLAQGMVAVLQERQAVNYRMFGAVGDGENDDGVQMKLAHQYANQHRLPVINLSGEYWIKETVNIRIMTNVQWGQTRFHIDEKHNLPGAPRFVVANDQPAVSLELTPALKKVLLEKIRPGVQIIPELAPYAGHLFSVVDEADRIGIRAGYEGNRGWAREELFYVEEGGRIIGDIAFAFKDFTGVSATPCNDVYTTIEGGGFYVSGESPLTGSTGYHYNGFSIQRSRTVIREQWVGLEPGAQDLCTAARHGFYTLSRVYDVTLENIRLMPWVYRRAAPLASVQHGTYGIGGSRMLNCVFRNLTAEAGPASWGVFGTNINKNFRVQRCRLNRVDVHFHCWNLYIQDSEIGYGGISVTGGGDLLVDNTIRFGNEFIAFRSDYGSRWEGRIRLRGCTLRPNGPIPAAVLAFRPGDFDYQYPIVLGESITIEDMVVDYSALPESIAPCWLVHLSVFAATKGGWRMVFPEQVNLRDIRVRGREQGVRLMRIPDPYRYEMPRPGGVAGGRLQANCMIEVANVQLEQLTPAQPDDREATHLLSGNPAGGEYVDNRALYPHWRFSNCHGICAHLSNCTASAYFEHCTINTLTAASLQGTLGFDHCDFAPQVTAAAGELYTLEAACGTRLTNCVLQAPVVAGQVRPELIDRSGIVQINGPVRYYHLNTSLGQGVLNYLQATGKPLADDFVERLRLHHGLQ